MFFFFQRVRKCWWCRATLSLHILILGIYCRDAEYSITFFLIHVIHTEGKNGSKNVPDILPMILSVEGGHTVMVFIRHPRSENSPFTTQNSPANV